MTENEKNDMDYARDIACALMAVEDLASQASGAALISAIEQAQAFIKAADALDRLAISIANRPFSIESTTTIPAIPGLHPGTTTPGIDPNTSSSKMDAVLAKE